MTLRPLSISVTDPISPAMRRTGQLLFKPFNFKRWAVIAFAFWLSMLGEGGGGFNFNFPSGSGSSGRSGGGSVRDPIEEVLQWMNANLVLVIAIMVVVTLIAFAIYMLYRWLSSRGHFMVLDATTRRNFALGDSWRNNRDAANSFFKFRLIADFVVFNAIFIFVVIGALLAAVDLYNVWPVLENYELTAWTVIGFLVAVLGGLAMAILFLIPYGLMQQFVPAIMRATGLNAWPAAKYLLRELIRPNLGTFVLFVLMNVVIGLVVASGTMVVTLILMLLTCCILALFTMIPVVGNFALYPIFIAVLPFLVFARCYSLYFLAQFDQKFNLFEDDTAPTGFRVVVNDPSNAGVPPTPQ